MSTVLPFPSRLSGRPLVDVFAFDRIGDLELLLMHPPGDEPAPLAIVLRAGTALVEVATVGNPDDPAAAVRDAHTFVDALCSALGVIRDRGVLRDAFLADPRQDDGGVA